MSRKTEKTLEELYDNYFRADARTGKVFVFSMIVSGSIAFFAITQIAISIFNNK